MVAPSAGPRLQWHELPEDLRTWVGDVLGAPVVAAHSQLGGFSPGTADRVRTAAGARAFVKAVSSAQNQLTLQLHRQEAHVVAHLPASARTPRLIDVYDDGSWVALVMEDIEGHQPSVPWQSCELEAVWTTLEALADSLTPSPLVDVPSMVDSYAEPFAGWVRLHDDPPTDLDPSLTAHLDELADLSNRGLAALAGSTLVHGDVRADNLLVRQDGSVAVVDWPWASIGAPWMDRLLLLVNVDLYGGHDPESWIDHHLRDVDPDDLTAVIAGLCGYFTDVARQPSELSLPTVRAFQADQARSTQQWLRRRLDRGESSRSKGLPPFDLR